MKKFYGTITMISIQKTNGESKGAGIKKIINFQAEGELEEIIFCEIIGDILITPCTHAYVNSTTVRMNKNRKPSVVYAGNSNTEIDISAVEKAVGDNTNTALRTTPRYTSSNQEKLYEHFKAIASSVNTPTYLHNIPSQTGIRLLPETIIRLSQIPNICGIGDSVMDIRHIKKVAKNCPEDFGIVSGSDKGRNISPVSIGAIVGKGIVSVASDKKLNIPTESHIIFKDLTESVQAGGSRLFNIMQEECGCLEAEEINEVLELMEQVQLSEYTIPATPRDIRLVINVAVEMYYAGYIL